MLDDIQSTISDVQESVHGDTGFVTCWGDVEVTYSEGVLHIAAQRKAESTSRAWSYLRRELTLGNYVRTIQLPGDVRENEIKASFDKGILTVDIPKVPKSQPVKIQVTGKSQKHLVGTGSQK